MKEKPILMSTLMVQATLKDVDPKTQTRRTKGLDKINLCPDSYKFVGFKNTLGYPASEGFLWAGFQHKDSPSPIYIKCPYGQVGDRLWVRETHYLFGHWVKNGLTKAGKQKWAFRNEIKGEVLYEDCKPDYVKTKKTDRGWFKRTSIFMPRWASRITLEITDIKVQRLWEITREDCVAEGLKLLQGGIVSEYAFLWNKVNGKNHPWRDNPFVWVISFKRVV